MITIAAAYIFFSLLVGAFAAILKRSGLMWMLISIIISPLFAFIILIILGNPTLPGLFASLGEKTCPQCAEKIKRKAKICRHCGYTFPTEMPKELKKLSNKILTQHDKAIANVEQISDILSKQDQPASPKRFKTRDEYEKWRTEKLAHSQKRNEA